jgi:flagellar biosynthesis protein FlhF
MRLKSFHGNNLTEAMRHVREALGENAIIIATRDDDTGGVRVTAAIEDAPPPAPAATPSTNYLAPAPEPDGSEVIERIAEALTQHHVAAHVAERIVATAIQFTSDDPVLALGAALDTHMKFQPIADTKDGRTLILIGPPGAGKTLCIAKFATKATMAKRPVTVISTDFERAGGLEQLAAFTRLLKVNLVEIEDAHALKDLVDMQKGAHIFIDTAGRNPFIETERQQLQDLVKAAGGEAVLVLPCGMDAGEAAEMAAVFQRIGAKRLLLTRLDLARRLGSALNLAFETKLPLANYNASGRATDAPRPLNPVTLARLILFGVEAAPEQKNS